MAVGRRLGGGGCPGKAGLVLDDDVALPDLLELVGIGTAENVGLAPPVRPAPLTQDGLLGLFKSEVVGRGVILEPATMEDMCGKSVIDKPSLEVVYDAA